MYLAIGERVVNTRTNKAGTVIDRTPDGRVAVRWDAQHKSFCPFRPTAGLARPDVSYGAV